jgi:hypothetical protein
MVAPPSLSPVCLSDRTAHRAAKRYTDRTRTRYLGQEMWDGRERGRSRAKIRNQSIPYPPTYHVPHAGTRLSLRPFPSFCGLSAHERESVSAVILSAHQSSRIAAQLSSFSCRCATERETETGKAEICRPIFLFLIRELISSPSIFPCLALFASGEPTCRGWCA